MDLAYTMIPNSSFLIHEKMLVSKSWLQDFVKLPDKNDKDIAENFTLHTAEIEGVRTLGQHLDHIVVGEIVTIQKHPNADTLKLVSTKIGADKTVEIICGGINLKDGMKVAVALPGAKVRWHGEGEPVELKKTEIRGVESHGMICASSEIGLAEQFPAKELREIMDISFVESKAGTPLKKALGLDDVIFEVDNKSITNRPDLWGHFGIAREFSVLYNTKLKTREFPKIVSKNSTKLRVQVKETKLCPRYMAVQIDGIKIQPSPDWMQKRLLACGIRSINNIVDVTNYVLLELGQPMHAFDAKKLGSSIIVRKAKKGESIAALDENTYELTHDDLIIADYKKAVAIAGVMGGMESAVDKNTTSLIFESANFDPISIRKTAARLGLRSESSARFEKSLDPTNCENALQRAVELTRELCPKSQVVNNVADDNNFKVRKEPIKISEKFFNKKIGVEVPSDQIKNILQQLGFGVQKDGDMFSVTIPTWRATKDISIPADVVEEVARIYGYDNITASMPRLDITPPPACKIRNLERSIRNFLAFICGMTETLNYSFVSKQQIKKMGSEFQTSDHLELFHPISKERPYLRQSLLPGILENIEKNISYHESISIFEIGTVFFQKPEGPKESPRGANLPGQRLHAAFSYVQKGNKNPYPHALFSMEGLLKNLSFEYEIKKPKDEKGYLHPLRQSEIHVHGQRVAFVGELHPLISQNFGIKERVAIAKINLSKLNNENPQLKKFKTIPEFPEALRDIAFVVSEDEIYENILETIRKASKLISKCELFDMYRGKNIDDNYKSMAFHITYQAAYRTLGHDEVEKAHTLLKELLIKKYKARIR